MLLPAEPAKPHRRGSNTCGQRLLDEASTRQLTYRIGQTQGLKTRTRQRIGCAPEPGEQIVFVLMLWVLCQPGLELHL
ncbi:hypothetical protein D3C77_467130 [compost metagenome]